MVLRDLNPGLGPDTTSPILPASVLGGSQPWGLRIGSAACVGGWLWGSLSYPGQSQNKLTSALLQPTDSRAASMGAIIGIYGTPYSKRLSCRKA